jgi:hypothetical protein
VILLFAGHKFLNASGDLRRRATHDFASLVARWPGARPATETGGIINKGVMAWLDGRRGLLTRLLLSGRIERA